MQHSVDLHHHNISLEQARFWKLTLSTILATVVVVEAVTLGFSAFTSDPTTIVTSTLRLVFAIYLFTLAARSINQDTVDAHSESLWHLSSLTL